MPGRLTLSLAARPKAITGRAKIHLGVNSHFRRKRYFLFAGDQLERRQEASRPACSELDDGIGDPWYQSTQRVAFDENHELIVQD